MPAPFVCTLVYDRLCTFEYGICVEVFSLQRPEIQEPLYRFKSVAMETGPLRATGGLEVVSDEDLSLLLEADLILIPGWRGAAIDPPDHLLQTLRKAHQRGARIASICSGVFVLAATGLLDGKRATTHWRYADPLRSRYPQIDVQPDILYVDEGSILTSAGSAAGLDLCLHIVRTDHGAKVANQIARSLVIPAHREGGQAQYIPSPVPKQHSGSLGPTLDQVRGNLEVSWSIPSLAGLAKMSKRTLLRRFQETCGESPLSWLTRERISRSKVLLETSDHPLPHIMEAVGFSSPETFRLHFKRQVGVSPARYRERFRPSNNSSLPMS